MLVHPPVCQFVFPPVIQVFFLDSSGQTRRLCQINTKWWAWPWLGALSGAGVRMALESPVVSVGCQLGCQQQSKTSTAHPLRGECAGHRGGP